MYIIAGLGNPGAKYSGSRHNTGFESVDILAENYKIAEDFEKHRAICGKGVIEGEKALILKPLTFMNLSGESVLEAVSYYKVNVQSELIVVYDDIDLDVGKMRIRKNGSAGGHNGMKNIVKLLGTEDFVRVRVGVGAKPAGWDLADWVLGHFDADDAGIMKEMHSRAAEAVAYIIKDGPDKAMNRFN